MYFIEKIELPSEYRQYPFLCEVNMKTGKIKAMIFEKFMTDKDMKFITDYMKAVSMQEEKEILKVLVRRVPEEEIRKSKKIMEKLLELW